MKELEQLLASVILAASQLALPHLRSKQLKRVLTSVSPTFPGFYLYYPSRRQQASKMKAFVDYVLAHPRKR